MAVDYPADLPLPLASKTAAKVPTFGMAQPRRGTPYTEPRATDSPTIYGVEWLLEAHQAAAFRDWVFVTLQGGSASFRISLLTESGPELVLAQFMPEGLLDRQRIGTLWRYTAAIVARAVSPIPDQEAILGVGFSLDLSPFWPPASGPFVWQLITGSLPSGLSLNTSNGVISGTTTSNPALFPIAVRRTTVADGSSFDSVVFNFVTARIVELVAPANCGSTAAVGVTVSGLTGASTYRLTLLDSPRMAWSGWAADNSTTPLPPPVLGRTWTCAFNVTNTSNVTASFLSYNTVGFFATAALAKANAAGFQGSVAGSTAYTFWLPDPNPSDNRGGLTVKIRPAF